jgi:UDPglucose--hexose-1-phosphate uridylyltransferase
VGYDGVFWEYVRIAPRLSIDAGFELGSGVGINITAPEDAARYLREASMASA